MTSPPVHQNRPDVQLEDREPPLVPAAYGQPISAYNTNDTPSPIMGVPIYEDAEIDDRDVPLMEEFQRAS